MFVNKFFHSGHIANSVIPISVSRWVRLEEHLQGRLSDYWNIASFLTESNFVK